MNTFYIIAVAIFGASIGSFLNVLILRLPHEKSMGGRSSCPHCKHILGASELIPILSYAVQLGKCRHCKKKISPRYVLIECATALLFVVSWLSVNPAIFPAFLEVLRLWFIVSVLVVVFVIDLEHYLILDRVIFPSLGALVALSIVLDVVNKNSFASLDSYTFGGIVAGLAPAIIFYALWRFSKGKWVGLGDVKFMLLIGLCAGWPNVWIALMLAFFSGTLVSLPLLALGKKQLTSKLPFGTFLSFGLLLALLHGDQILSWYLSLFGVV